MEQAPLSLCIPKEVVVCSGHQVLMEDEDDILLIVGDPQKILDHQFRPHTIHSFNTFNWLIN